ncbi:MAG: serine/threonine protein kinase [Myxococcota bacterium]
MSRYIRNYEVVRELGSGHFGAVYLAVGEVPGRGRTPGRRRMVAIKKLKNSADQESVELLLQEFSLLEQVKHRCIVRVYEYLEEENAVVMEYIHGVTLRKVLEELDKAHEQVFTEAAVEIGCELADALYQAYTSPGDNGEPLQLIHRDLKPANVMLTPTGEIKILDFGLARVDNTDFAIDNPDRIRGTPIYMAPEQASGLALDHRTDLFAAGLIIYELLMGEAAYRVPTRSADPLGDVMRAIEAGDLGEQCRSLEARLPALGPVLTRTLQRRPEDRYRDGQELLVDLKRQLYRDSGAYRKEFCEFFYGPIYDIGEAPSLDSVAASAPRRRSQKSIEERLRESMARDKQASANFSSPKPSQPTPPRQGGPPAPPRGVPRSTASGGGNRRPPPVGGGASRAQTFTPAARGGSGQRIRAVGERTPDETGMLHMVPLTDDATSDAGGDPSATAFFAIPAPRSNRARPTAPAAPPPAPGGVMGGMGAPPIASSGMASAPPPPRTPPPPRPSYGGGIGAGGAGAGGIAQGPVAGYGNAGGANAQTPFQVQGGPGGATTSNPDESRSRSYQIYAILFALFVMVCVTGVTVVWVVLISKGDPTPPEVVAKNPVTQPTPIAENTDTGLDEPEVVTERVVSKKKKKRVNPNPPVVSPPKPPSTPTGEIRVSIDSAAPFTAVEVICPSGVRERGYFSNGNARVTGIPSENCSLNFKGGAPAKFSPVSGGASLKCSYSGSTMSCN